MERAERFRKVVMQFADPYADNCKKLYFIGKNPTRSILFMNFLGAGCQIRVLAAWGQPFRGGGNACCHIGLQNRWVAALLCAMPW